MSYLLAEEAEVKALATRSVEDLERELRDVAIAKAEAHTRVSATTERWFKLKAAVDIARSRRRGADDPNEG